MREIRLSGRERSVIRAIGFGSAVSGEYLLERTGLAPDDLTETLNGMLSTGFAESTPAVDSLELEQLASLK
ncbi:MAG: hypothetical protein SNJ52_03830, partial [Verrucomicrobiia bacterium]